MIDINKIKSIKKIVVHKNCHDGMASAMIIKDVLHDVEVFFADHNDDDYINMKAEEGLLFCDISPPLDREKEFLDVESIVLDHHESAKKLVLKFQERDLGVYGETFDGVSGAVLAYRHVWERLQGQAKTNKLLVCRLSRLAGIYDTFQKDSIEWEDAEIQTETLTFYPSNYWLKNHIAAVLISELKVGETILEKQKSLVDNVKKSPYTFKWKDKTIAIITGHKIVNSASDELRKLGIPITLSFYFDINKKNPKMLVSIRSDGSFNCSKFASFFDGGGHIKSAGMSIPINENDKNPFYILQKAINDYGSECLIGV